MCSSLMMVIGLTLFWGGETAAHPYGEPDAAVPEAAQFQYCRGKWLVTIEARDEQGHLKPMETQGPIISIGRYLEDGRTFQTTFSVNRGKAFFSTQLKAWHSERKRWVNSFVNARDQRWVSSDSFWRDGEMVTLVYAGYTAKEPYMSRETDKDIGKNRFVKVVQQSHDGGATWARPAYILTYTRIE
ncbi:hypothetical protein SCOR_07725 [Sulfidibacter corallicola]|uniref:DUF1579 domain-containing protein n=1 Tax=Sulfidibacter corallicola TaxID=2818388 RepID=A0A8A4TQR7_SULCO|nr:hypothetical protein [Sulfidibacter corallicola]QTD51348.1 hypothetical protein J3U87_02670 [Sulfidibacter corallicola]